uniref:Uncharacterized protein n=1 Tax=Macrostomum lignano TaxID=282301 RepID=A0A1I8F5A7_9PLAT
MFEVCCGRYPFGKCDRLPLHGAICRGERDPMHDLRASESIKEATHLRHSSSEPDEPAPACQDRFLLDRLLLRFVLFE